SPASRPAHCRSRFCISRPLRGLRIFWRCSPAINRWAIFSRSLRGRTPVPTLWAPLCRPTLIRFGFLSYLQVRTPKHSILTFLLRWALLWEFLALASEAKVASRHTLFRYAANQPGKEASP